MEILLPTLVTLVIIRYANLIKPRGVLKIDNYFFKWRWTDQHLGAFISLLSASFEWVNLLVDRNHQLLCCCAAAESFKVFHSFIMVKCFSAKTTYLMRLFLYL